MRILYCAIDQTVPGTLGGSVHVQAVAEGLARLGHDVCVLRKGSGVFLSREIGPPLFFRDAPPPLGVSQLRWMRRGTVRRIAREMRAEVIIERYHNFGGEGVLAADALGIPSVLEVNAPVIDYPGSLKQRLDRALLVQPMRRWRERLCRLASLLVTPTTRILPAWVDPSKVLEIEWGADTERFKPASTSGVDRSHGVDPRGRDDRVDRRGRRVVCVFSGAFRRWHGAVTLADTLARRTRAGDDRFAGLFIGDGPERAAAERAAAGIGSITFTGALPHDQVPARLASADIGVAPFDVTRHPPLQLSFYWSPLKIFEYMASGLPVVAPALPRLQQIVEHGREGWLYAPADPRGLDDALEALVDPAVRAAMGTAARERVVRDFSWQAHCRALDARLRQLVRT
jgi:glycosyltransferase involved in cell wall biosynthesis